MHKKMIGFRNFCTSSLTVRDPSISKNEKLCKPIQNIWGKEKEDVVDGGYS